MSGMANPPFLSSDDIIDFASKFPSMELTAPKIIQWTTSGYERVPEIGCIFKLVTGNHELRAGRDASMTLSKLRNLQEDIKTLQHVYAFYGGYTDDTKLNYVQAQAEEDERRVRDLISAYREDPTHPLRGPLALHSLANGSPSREYVVEVFGVKKVHGYTTFDDVDLTTYFDQHRKITAIQLHTSPSLVSCIVVAYTDDKGTVTVTHGTHDNDPGSMLTRQLVVQSGHYGGVPPWVPASVDEIVTGLHAGLYNGESIEDGAFVGSSFTWTVKRTEAFLLGFRGSKDWFIDVLQLVYTSFSPASSPRHYLARGASNGIKG